MSAAFQLDFTGPQVAQPKPKPVEWIYDRRCMVCGVSFTVIGAGKDFPAATCGDQACIQRYAQHFATPNPVLCTCAQRPYPHVLTVHDKIEIERPGVYLDYYDNAIRFAPEGMRWPWSLRYAPKMEANS